MSRLVSGDSPNITSGFPRKSRNENWIQWLNPVDVFKNIIAGEQKRARRLILTWVVSSTYLNRIADLKENVGTFLAFLCSSTWNEWYGAKSGAKALLLSLRSVA